MARLERGRPRDPGNDAAILDAALDLLIERGAAGASIEAIARRSGVGSKVTVYRRWKSKEDLLMAALEHARGPESDPDDTSLEMLIDTTAASLSDARFRTLMVRVIGASVEYPALVDAYTDRHLRPRLDTLALVARASVASGDFPPDTDPAVIEDAFAGAIGVVLLRRDTAPRIAARLRATLSQLGYRPQRRPESR
ncbi:MAG: TetR/AcrR family transcriptional regulator [Pseudonocardia sp.]|nr:TetR/AcrR family transcriptional regulator [Pseudonocardia sp.]